MKSLTKSLAALALFGAVTVHAQTAPTTPAGPAPAAPAAGRQLTAAEMAQRATELEAQITDDAQHMQHLQELARKEKDVVKLTCVNDKLVELKAQQNIFDVANQQFNASRDTQVDTARASYEEMSTTASQVKSLRGEAEACVGVPDLYKQESDVDVTHPDFPDDPTITDPFAVDIEPPAYASPFS